ncbi:MAG: response regulator transcription factor [Verrucomicrobia bacterium]|nr:response regulator transcription factor [Verrucomicrobiota bacterium]MCH8512027.1 response regulator transcription factor [Kiritimatiellia bacterium]
MNSDQKITVILAEDHLIVREGLLRILEANEKIEVIGEAATGREALEMTLELKPDVILMDIAMPELNGVEATRQIRAASPETKVIVLSAHSDDVYVERMMELGASGYLIKQTSAQHLAEAILEVYKGNTFFSPLVSKTIARQNLNSLDRLGRKKTKKVELTTREMEVLQLVAEGAANKQIAGILEISIKTVEKHRDRLMQKLDIHETASLTRYAIESGVIESSVQPTHSVDSSKDQGTG